ncbi:palmitoyl-(protein) hydrolase [Aureococcus anophagefferens]|nr:palmitoyl-(protein) hydrolase [Aureococcus anophagefferens]
MLAINYETSKRQGVHNPHVQARLGWAFGAFRSPHHGWLIRRVWLTIWVCAEHCAHQPYHSERLNTLETYGLAWTATTDSAAHLVANLVGAEDDSLDGDAKAAVDALGELTNGLHPVAWRAWVAQDAPGDLELASGVAGALATIIGDESSFTSVYSSDARSAYWKTLAARFPGMIDFAANMDGGERVFFGGCLATPPLARTRRGGAAPPVDERDRASVLYFLCACGEEDHARLVALLRQVVAPEGREAAPVEARAFALRSSAVSRRDSVQRRASRALAATAVDAGDLLFDVDDVAAPRQGSKRERNSQLQRLISRPFSTRFG